MKFLVIDDHALIREAMGSVLRVVRSGCLVLEALQCGGCTGNAGA
jgi:hypothetical protein